MEEEEIVWQDWMITAIQWSLGLALLPALFGPVKPDKWTCVLTGGLIFCFTIPFSTLDMWWSVASAFSVSMLWFILLFQERT